MRVRKKKTELFGGNKIESLLLKENSKENFCFGKNNGHSGMRVKPPLTMAKEESRSQAWCLHAAQSEHSGGSR